MEIGGIGTQQRTQSLQGPQAPVSHGAQAPAVQGATAADTVQISSEAQESTASDPVADAQSNVQFSSERFDHAMGEVAKAPNGKEDIKGIVGLARQQGDEQAKKLAEQNGGKPEDYQDKLDKDLLLAGAGVQYSTQKIGEFSQGLKDQGKSDTEIQQAIGENSQMQRYLNLGSSGARYINARHELHQAEQRK